MNERKVWLSMLPDDDYDDHDRATHRLPDIIFYVGFFAMLFWGGKYFLGLS